MQHCVSEIAICKCVGTVLQPDNECMKLAEGADARVVDEVVDHHIRHDKTGCCINYMCKSNPPPRRVELVPVLLSFRTT